MATLKQWAKSKPAIYRSFKLARDLPQFPLRRSDLLDKLPAIWKTFPQTMLPPARLFNLADAVDSVNAEEIGGDIAECGVWSGGALAFAALWDLRNPRSERHYHGFDSFEGLPPPTPDDNEVFHLYSVVQGREVTGQREYTGICVGDDADSVRQFFHQVGVPASRSHFHVGWFQDTVPAAGREIEALSILRIDGDWYDSTRVCLIHLYDLVSPGGWVIIDDYGAYTGCRKAVDEFRQERGIATELVQVDHDCVYFRKPRQ